MATDPYWLGGDFSFLAANRWGPVGVFVNLRWIEFWGPLLSQKWLLFADIGNSLN
jgi:hypothetical protein